MAEFCKQCSIENFGEDFGDFKGLSSIENTNKELGIVVICEGCGYIIVDHEGSCMSKDCLKHGQEVTNGAQVEGNNNTK